jgi:hypothetical protein
MKVVFIGNEKLWFDIIGKNPSPRSTGFTYVTTPKGTPVLYVSGLGDKELWVVDVLQKVMLLGEGMITLSDFLEAL